MLENMIQNLGNDGCTAGGREDGLSGLGGVELPVGVTAPWSGQGRKHRNLSGSFMALSSPQASRGRSPSSACPRSGPQRAKAGRPELPIAGTRALALLRKRLVLGP